MSKKATYLRLVKSNHTPKTLTLPTIVGEPLYAGSTIRLTDEAQIDLLLNDPTFKTDVLNDGELVVSWFEDVTDEYAAKEAKRSAKPTASTVDNEPPAEEEGEEEETTDGETEGEATEEAKEEETKDTKSGQRATRTRK